MAIHESTKARSRKGIGGRPKGPFTTVVRLPLRLLQLTTRRLAAGTLKGGDLNAFLDVEARTSLAVPMTAATASCGFPSPADEYLDAPLDFNELLIPGGS